MRGAAAVAVKVSPGWTFHEVFDNDPLATFSHVASALSARRIAYFQVGNYGMDWDVYGILRRHFQGPQIAVGGFIRATAAALIGQGTVDMVAFGHAYIAHPQPRSALPDRIADQPARHCHLTRRALPATPTTRYTPKAIPRRNGPPIPRPSPFPPMSQVKRCASTAAPFSSPARTRSG